MDIVSLFSGNDNLYKHLFVGGLGMLLLSLFYPLEKKFQLNNQIDNYNKEIRFLNFDIEKLSKNITDFDSESYINTVNKLSKKNSKTNRKLKENIKKNFNAKFDSLTSQREQIAIKEINLKSAKDSIVTLEKHLQEYQNYTRLFFWGGLIFMISGTIGWAKWQHKGKEEKETKK